MSGGTSQLPLMETSPQKPPAAPGSVAIPPAFTWLKLAWKPAATEPKTPAPRPQPSRVKLALTLEDAGTLYTVLRDKTGPVRHTKPSTAKPAADLARLLETLDASLRRLPATAPAETILALELPPKDAAYLRAMIGNKKRDEWRYVLVRSRGVVSLDALMTQAEAAGESGTGASMTVPADTDRPERAFRQSEIKRALAGLPGELTALLGPLEECGGNVSELARRLGQPQRKTARQVTRIRKHLEKLGLGPV